MLSGLTNLLKENVQQKDVFIEVNPFLHSSSKALQLIAGLNQSVPEPSSDNNVFSKLDELIYSDDFIDVFLELESDFNTFQLDSNSNLSQYRSIQSFWNIYEQMIIDVNSSRDEDWTKIVLGGEFSSGKSSFLNSLLCEENEIEFLPVSEKPTSVIPTFIYCSESQQVQRVIGENKQKGKMFLSLHALLALGHDFERKHKISLATFLDKLIIQQPIKKDFLKEIMFIDTPGYSKEDGESQTDQQKAVEAIKQGEVLFWLIDIDSGTIKKQDLEFIKNNFDAKKPKVIIFNKADKKPNSEIEKIINDAARLLKAETDSSIIDIIAYSSHDRQILGSYKRKGSWQWIFNQVKSKALKKKAEQYFIDNIQENQKRQDNAVNSICKEWDLRIRDINKEVIDLTNEKKYSFSGIINELDYYYSLACQQNRLAGDFCTVAVESLNRELDWGDKVGMFNNADSLWRRREVDSNTYNELVRELNDTRIEDIDNGNLEYLESVKNYLNDKLIKEPLAKLKEEREYLKDVIDKCTSNLYKFNEVMDNVQLLLIRAVIELNNRKKSNNYDYLRIVGVINSSKDIFKCIVQNDFDGFLDCLAKRTEIYNLTDIEGHNILSLAVKHRRYDMVSVLLPKGRSLVNKKEGKLLSAKEIADEYKDQMLSELLENL